MRYDPKRRITFPSAEDWRLWIALNRIGASYDKIPFINSDAPHTENWYMTARVRFDDTHYGYIDWAGNQYITSHSYNQGTKRTRERRLAWLDEHGIPYLLLRRRAEAYEHEIEIRKWIDKNRKEGKYK
jgi:hypothetical protein